MCNMQRPQVYVYRGDSWIPQRMQRTAVELRHMEATDVASPGKMKGGKGGGSRGIELQASNHGGALMSTNRCEGLWEHSREGKTYDAVPHWLRWDWQRSYAVIARTSTPPIW